MDQALRQRLIGVWIGAAAVLVASFLPWGTIVAKATISIPGVPEGAFPGITTRFTFTGWVGTVKILGMSFPNWLTVVLALAAAGVTTLGATGAWNPPRRLAAVLAGLGLAQIVAMMVVFVGGSGPNASASLDGGILIALASFVGLIRACVKVTPPVVQTPA